MILDSPMIRKLQPKQVFVHLLTPAQELCRNSCTKCLYS